MINEHQREFGAMRALGANLGHLRRFLFTEAATIGGLSLIIGAIVGVGLAFMLVMLLGVIFTIPAPGLVAPTTDLLLLAGMVTAGMVVSAFISARRLATLKVVEAFTRAMSKSLNRPSALGQLQRRVSSCQLPPMPRRATATLVSPLSSRSTSPSG